MKPGTVLLFIASLLCATALTPTVLNAAQMSTLKQSPIVVDIDWFSECVAASACPSNVQACNSPTLRCSYCSTARTSGECNRGALSSCAESSGPAGYCGSAVSGICGGGTCTPLAGTVPSISCLITSCNDTNAVSW
jgi:hypothetical protein